MTQSSESARFFGLDMSQFKRELALALRLMAVWPIFRWLTPGFATRLVLSNGETADYLEKQGGGFFRLQPVGRVRFFGVVLPQELVLWQTVLLPSLAASELRGAIELQIPSLSPFSIEDTVWGYIAAGTEPTGRETHIVVASRKIILRHLASVAKPQLDPDTCEVWVVPPGGKDFLVLDGFGEKSRRRLTVHWRWVNFCLAGLLAVVAMVAAVAPSAQLRLRAIEASQDYGKLQVLAEPALRQRELFVRLEQKIKVLEGYQQLSIQPEMILLRLTRLLPDDTYVTSVQVQGTKILLTGQTPNASALMQQLGAEPGVKNVRAPSAAFRPRGADRENFNIEFMLDAPSKVAKP